MAMKELDKDFISDIFKQNVKLGSRISKGNKQKRAKVVSKIDMKMTKSQSMVNPLQNKKSLIKENELNQDSNLKTSVTPIAVQMGD